MCNMSDYYQKILDLYKYIEKLVSTDEINGITNKGKVKKRIDR